jgi:hypothetical protein
MIVNVNDRHSEFSSRASLSNVNVPAQRRDLNGTARANRYCE